MKNGIKIGYVRSLIIAFFVVISGCNVTSNKQSNTRPVNVYMQSKTAFKAYANPYGLSEFPTTAAVDSSLKLTRVSLFVKELRLKSVAEDSLDFNQKDIVVDLPLGQDSVQISTTAVPQGSYDGVSLQIGRPSFADSAKYPDFVSGPSEHDRYSVIIQGSYLGQDFTFRARHEFEFHLKINPPLIVSDSTVSVDVNLLVDTSKWFVDRETGQPINPTDREAIEKIIENIDSSMEAHRREHEMEDGHHNNHDQGSNDNSGNGNGSGN